jgi:large repetitive protein
LYSPDLNFHGTDSFTFKVNDGVKDSNISTVSITVTEVNDSPTAVDDAKSINEDTALIFPASDLTGNDSAGPADEGGQILTVTSVTGDANTHGSVTLSSGSISYSPDPNFNGPASFQYQVCDNGSTNGAPDSQCTVGTVNVTVNPINDVPVANSQAKATNGNTPVSVTLTGSDLETAPANLAFTVTLGPSHGALSGTAPNLTYTPALNYTGPDSFKFTVTDTGDGDAAALTSAEATVSLFVNDTINPTVSAPANVVAFTSPGAVTCGAVVGDATLGVANANDNSGSVSVSRTGVPAGNNFPVGTTTLTYTAIDPSGNAASATQTVTVIDNTPPTLTLKGNTIYLWPPNHKYATIKVSDLVASASDNCDASVNLSKVAISKVTSDEVENSEGTLNDIVIGPNCKSVQLRAERVNGGDGRVYTITFQVTDAAGNVTIKTAQVLVPSESGLGAIDSGPQYTVVGSCP